MPVDEPPVAQPVLHGVQPNDQRLISVVIPIYNEEANLAALYPRVRETMEGLPYTWELIFVDDGSRDRSLELLTALANQDIHLRVVELVRNYGQHSAILAGFEQSRGEIVITLDGDLQNPPEEIPRLVAKIEEGFEVVGGWRQERCDSWLRKLPSYITNKVTARITGVPMHDYGCMLRAYRRDVVQRLVKCSERSTFIPVLANTLARRVTEIPVAHAQRAAGQSKYNLFKLVRLQLDLTTAFSTLPLKLCSVFGLCTAIAGLSFAAFLMIRRLIVGPEVEGVFTLFAILFFFVGAQFLAVGLLGEYVGRIYNEVRDRPRFLIHKIYEGHSLS